MTPAELTELLHREIPLSAAIGLQVSRISEQNLTIEGPFEPNRNIHQTVFAGSIYCFATLAGWSLVHQLCEQQGIDGAIVLRRATIEYRKPLSQAPLARAHRPEAIAVSQFLERLEKKGRAVLEVTADLIQGEQSAAHFVGEYVVIKES